MLSVNPQEIGLKVGLEIHQQLDTKHKLFCSCPTELSDDQGKRLIRMLRPTQSELGEVDEAALFEFRKARVIEYEAPEQASCLVEMDEEPPHRLNEEAIDIALTVALLLGSKPVDEVHVMRKTVIDGSNTTGFQRTCVVSIGGSVGGKIGIQHISVEEDAARKIKESGGTSTYRIDRLGIPLIEIATAPSISSPEEAEEVALEIGRLLRATGRVKRGLGTIRQDLNVSTRDGALIEIKGVQQLDLIAEVVKGEVARQLSLLKVKEELKSRGLEEEDLRDVFHDVTDVFSGTASRVLASAIQRGGLVLAVKLPRFAGLVGMELQKGVRLGTEMAHRAVFWGGVGGIFHTDELPNYGISASEVQELRRRTGAAEDDAVVFIADTQERASQALKAVVERARECLRGVPEETRAAREDGTTRYMRPRPGAARMYPETDVPPLVITEERLAMLQRNLPPLPGEVAAQLMQTYKINRKLAEQLLDSGYLLLFQDLARTTRISASFIATILTEVLKSLQREGVQVEALTDSRMMEVFRAVDSGLTAKEAVPEILKWLAERPESTVNEAVEKLGVSMMGEEELKRRISMLLDRNQTLLQEHGQASAGRLMNMIMAEVRGRAEPAYVDAILKEEIKRRVGRGGL
ncbi:Glu-tRNA(Gln) amidotransferase subunit GatE [Candidatus Bathyarchaeota archaeon]|nr:Glu-tRNA(Gln) amidotransferase subunit GatE [Candidatus Bathyarchaeota archaeon]